MGGSQACTGACCKFSNYTIEVSDWLELYVVNIILSLALLLSMGVLVFKIHRAYFHSLESEKLRFRIGPDVMHGIRVLPVYFSFAHVATLVFFFTVLALLTLPSSNVAIVITDVLFAMQCGFLDNVVVLFLLQRDATPRSTKRAIWLAIAGTAVYAAVLMVFHLQSSCSFCNSFLPVPEILWVYTGFSIVYMALLGAIHRGWIFARPALKIWISYLLLPYGTGSLGLLIQRFADGASGYCVFHICVFSYAFGWAYMYWRVMLSDSKYVREHGLLQGASTITSPLLEAVSTLSRTTDVRTIPYDELEMHQRIGVGGYGEVWSASWRGSRVAVKKLFVSFLTREDDKLAEFLKEIDVLRRLRHPNIVLFMGVAIQPDTEPRVPCIVTEWVPRGSLFELLHTSDAVRLPRAARMQVLRDVARGMVYLHGFAPSIIHRDLKPHNVLIDDTWRAKICDFGLAREQQQNTMTRVGTLQWTAPEVLRDAPYDKACDVYSFAMVAWELYSGAPPFDGDGSVVVMHRVAFQKVRPELPASMPAALAALVTECWSDDPAARPSFEAVLARLEAMPDHGEAEHAAEEEEEEEDE